MTRVRFKTMRARVNTDSVPRDMFRICDNLYLTEVVYRQVKDFVSINVLRANLPNLRHNVRIVAVSWDKHATQI